MTRATTGSLTVRPRLSNNIVQLHHQTHGTMPGTFDSQLGKLEDVADEIQQRGAAIEASTEHLERDIETQGMTEGIKKQATALRVELAEVEQATEEVKRRTLSVVQQAKTAVEEQAKAA